MGPSLTPTHSVPRGCKSATADSAHHVGSSSGLIIIVAMALYVILSSQSGFHFKIKNDLQMFRTAFVAYDDI